MLLSLNTGGTSLNSIQKFRLYTGVAHVASIALIIFFFISLIFTFLPGLPRYPTNREDWGWFITAWNLPGPLMFIIVFRVHALRVIRDHILKVEKVLGITFWVKFWFTVAVAFGLVTLPFVANVYLAGSAGMPLHISAGVICVVLAWLTLLFSTMTLLRIRCSKAMLPAVEQARKINRALLAPSSIVFLFFTGLSSITILFP